jgi:hypothetical protein
LRFVLGFEGVPKTRESGNNSGVLLEDGKDVLKEKTRGAPFRFGFHNLLLENVWVILSFISSTKSIITESNNPVAVSNWLIVAVIGWNNKVTGSFLTTTQIGYYGE